MPSTHAVSQNSPPPPPPPSSTPPTQQQLQLQSSLKLAVVNNESEPCSSSQAIMESSRSADSNSLLRPCVALSEKIVRLYKLINKKYSEERRCRESGQKYNDGFDDRNGHYIAFTGEVINERYTVLGILGRGSFGTVLHCFDEKHQEQVAVKVIRHGEYFYDQGLMEVSILEELSKYPSLNRLVVSLRKVFLWKDHLVLVFEMLSMNLFQLIHRTNYNGVSLNLTRKFAYQMVLILKHLEDHDPPVIHCDVKPENVVLRHPKRSSISLIDFGSACYSCPAANLYKYVQSRFYRSVEVILELDYNTAIDRWSLACMLVELHTGVPLFAGRDEVDQLARIIAVLGPLPDDMIERSPKRNFFFYDLRRDQHYQQHQQQQQQQQQLYSFSHHGVGGEGWSSSGNTHGQRLDPYGNVNTAGTTEKTTSVSPIIAADVLQSMSVTSSISVATGTSTAVGEGVTTSMPTTLINVTNNNATTTTTPTPTKMTTPAEGQSLQRLPLPVSSSKGNNHSHSSLFTASGTRRPLTAVTVSVNKKGKLGLPTQTPPTSTTTITSTTTGIGIGGTAAINSIGSSGVGGVVITPVASKANNPLTSVGKKQRPKTHVGANPTTVVERHAQLPQWVTALLPLHSSSGPKPRLSASTSHSHSRGVSEGAPLSLSRSGRNRAQSKEEPHHHQQQQQQQPQQQQQQEEKQRSCVVRVAPKSPFVLRIPAKPEQRQTLDDIIGVYTCGPRGCRHGEEGHDVESYEHFADFVRRFLVYHPGKRMSCTEALQHPFLLKLETEYRTTYMSGQAP
ncbi:putative serine/threonine protein kinase [Trypanosoma theileri]|uniref:Putative serine/threonine protein kinase n=1 Tax=Trypanosoma theileri TaxID=67003 RepID=A0A1X0NP74_9TRYP|nr:putative serine/threonine protein kinase [Trypanosoma theileri]ORC86293.1 putative serine/threonine protein kinase [Trypanosoma theileri]